MNQSFEIKSIPAYIKRVPGVISTQGKKKNKNNNSNSNNTQGKKTKKNY